jgi:hypothetical protein
MTLGSPLVRLGFTGGRPSVRRASHPAPPPLRRWSSVQRECCLLHSKNSSKSCLRVLCAGVVAGRTTVGSIGRRRSAALALDDIITAETDSIKNLPACRRPSIGTAFPTIIPRRVENWPIDSLIVGPEPKADKLW